MIGNPFSFKLHIRVAALEEKLKKSSEGTSYAFLMGRETIADKIQRLEDRVNILDNDHQLLLRALKLCKYSAVATESYKPCKKSK